VIKSVSAQVLACYRAELAQWELWLEINLHLAAYGNVQSHPVLVPGEGPSDLLYVPGAKG
jgi:hypothetical protein